jgi:HTH-type transcriptional regulator/antitoxin HipB
MAAKKLSTKARAVRSSPGKPLPASHRAPLSIFARLPAQAGQILLSRRKALKLSQTEMASKLGIGQSRYSELESRPGSMSLEQFFSLAAILGVEILMQVEYEPRPANAAEW